MQNQQETLQDELDLDANAKLEDIQKSYQKRQEGLEQLMNGAETEAAKEFYRKQLLALTQRYQDFVQEKPLPQPVIEPLDDASQASKSQPVQKAQESYEPINKDAPKNEDRQKPKSDSTETRSFSEDYVNANLKEDDNSREIACSQDPAKAEKYELLKTMDPPVDVRFGLMHGKAELLINSKDKARAQEFLESHKDQQMNTSEKAPTPFPQWARKAKAEEEEATQYTAPSPCSSR